MPWLRVKSRHQGLSIHDDANFGHLFAKARQHRLPTLLNMPLTALYRLTSTENTATKDPLPWPLFDIIELRVGRCNELPHTSVSLSLTAWSLKIKALVRVHEISSKTKMSYLEQRIWVKRNLQINRVFVLVWLMF